MIRSLLKPTHGNVYLNIGECYLRLKQPKKALEVFHKLFIFVKNICTNDLSYVLMHSNYSQQLREMYQFNDTAKDKTEKLIRYYEMLTD